MEQAGKINVYVCPSCGARHVTRNRDAGTTPFLIRCRGLVPMRRRERRRSALPRPRLGPCDGMAQSSFYRVPQTLPPRFEWYRPDEDERRGLDEATREHVGKGGLLLRDLPAESEPAGLHWG